MMTKTAKIWNGINYLEYLPQKINGIILYFHGMGERGSDLNLLERNEIPKLYKNGLEKNYLTICPQLPGSLSSWSSSMQRSLLDLMEFYKAKYNVSVVHVTGLSLGGYTSISMVNQAFLKFSRDDYFTSAGIVCGKTSATDMTPFLGTPFKCWHGTADNTNKIYNMQVFRDRLTNAGGTIELVEYIGDDHIIWDRAYNPEDADSYFSFIEDFEGSEPQIEPVASQFIQDGELYVTTLEGIQYKVAVTPV
jgi:predicted peptidase